MMKYNPKNIQGTGHRDIESLHPVVQVYARNFLKVANDYLKPFGVECKIISTLRTWAEQNELYTYGRTKFVDKNGKKLGRVTSAVAGRSNHNWGVAFDIGLFKDGVYNHKDTLSFYEKLGPKGELVGLDWGGRWTNPVDYPHYQFTGKYSNREFLDKVTVDNIDELLTK